MRTGAIIALVVVFLGLIAGLSALSIYSTSLAKDSGGDGNRRSVNRQTVVEELAVPLHGVPGVMGIRCRLVRTDKLQRGAFSFGAFEVLALKNLEIVFPSGGALDAGPANVLVDGDAADETDVLTAVNLPVKLSSSAAPRRFVGVKIDGFSMARVVDGKVEPLLTAASGEMRKKALKLKQCRVLGVPWEDSELSFKSGKGFVLRGVCEGRQRQLVVPCSIDRMPHD